MDGLIEGRIVHYILTEKDVETIRIDRELSIRASRGNNPRVGDHVPMMVVKVWPDEFGPGVPGVNGQCFLDGNDSLWVTSAKYNDGFHAGTWHWIEKA